MTLISFATYGDHAEFITDTTWYTRYLEKLGLTTKHMHLTHLDAVILTQGDSEFGDYAQVSACKLGAESANFDALLRRLPDTLRAVYGDVGVTPERGPCTAFAIGYSEEAGEFVGVVHASEQAFKPLRVTQWLMPTPWTLRPSGIELRRLRESMADDVDRSRVDLLPTVEQRWSTMPKMAPPRDVDGWVELAKLANAQRTLDNYAEVLVLGNVIHGRLERGTATTSVVHTFQHTEEELQKILASTRHPIGQMQACWCGSGETFRDCHLRDYWADPCGCGSGQAFQDCCLVGAPVAQEITPSATSG